MDTRTATLLAAAAALTSSPGSASTPASEAPVPRVSSYAELLQPIPNATERLRAADLDTSNAAEQPQLIETQYYRDHHHHHHHHHHSREWYRSHGYWWNGGAWVLRPRRHHHHHHNNNY